MKITDSWPVTLHESRETTVKWTHWSCTQLNLNLSSCTFKTFVRAIWDGITSTACSGTATRITALSVTAGHNLPKSEIQVKILNLKPPTSSRRCFMLSQRILMRTMLSQVFL